MPKPAFSFTISQTKRHSRTLASGNKNFWSRQCPRTLRQFHFSFSETRLIWSMNDKFPETEFQTGSKSTQRSFITRLLRWMAVMSMRLSAKLHKISWLYKMMACPRCQDRRLDKRPMDRLERRNLT